MLTDRGDLGLGGVQLLARLWSQPGVIGDGVDRRPPILGNVPPHASLWELWLAPLPVTAESVQAGLAAPPPDVPKYDCDCDPRDVAQGIHFNECSPEKPYWRRRIVLA